MKNEILTLLRNGESMENIMSTLGKQLAEAEEAYNAEVEAKRKAEEEARKAKEEKAKREEVREYLLSEVLRTVQDYINEFYPNELEEGLNTAEKRKTLAQSFDSIIGLAKLTKEGYWPDMWKF